jgi:hypothetical protein
MEKTIVLWVSDGVYFEEQQFIVPFWVNIDTGADFATDLSQAIYHLKYRSKPDLIIIGRVALSRDPIADYSFHRKKRKPTIWEKAVKQRRSLRVEFVKYLLGADDALERIDESKKFLPQQIVIYHYGNLDGVEKEALESLSIANMVRIDYPASPSVVLDAVKQIVSAQKSKGA